MEHKKEEGKLLSHYTHTNYGYHMRFLVEDSWKRELRENAKNCYINQEKVDEI